MINGHLFLPTEQPNLFLDELTKDDATEFSRLTAANILHLTRHDEPVFSAQPTPQAATEFLQTAEQDPGVLVMGIFEEDILVGAASLVFRRGQVPDGAAEVGYWLEKGSEGKGYATAAVRALTAYARPKFDAIFAQVAAANHRSIGVLNRAGFEQSDSVPGGRLLFFLTKKSPK